MPGLRTPALALLAALAATASSAVEILITNPGFENPATGAGTFVTDSAPSGWSTYGSLNFSNRTVGVLNPGGTTLYGSVPGGSNVGVVFLSSGGAPASSPAGFQQTLSATLANNTTYTFSVSVGNIANDSTHPHNQFDFSGFPGYRLELVAGSTVVASQQNAVAPAEGTFVTTSFTYTTDDDDPLAGSTLAIRLLNLDASAGLEVNFDNVSLTATAVPEPATAAAALGLVFLGAATRRRFRRSPLRLPEA